MRQPMPRVGKSGPNSPSFGDEGDAALFSPPARASRVSDHLCLTRRGGPNLLAPALLSPAHLLPSTVIGRISVQLATLKELNSPNEHVRRLKSSVVESTLRSSLRPTVFACAGRDRSVYRLDRLLTARVRQIY
jgi:hypothetical protein